MMEHACLDDAKGANEGDDGRGGEICSEKKPYELDGVYTPAICRAFPLTLGFPPEDTP